MLLHSSLMAGSLVFEYKVEAVGLEELVWSKKVEAGLKRVEDCRLASVETPDEENWHRCRSGTA